MANFGLSTPATGTDAELLALVRKAIADITVSGQAVEIRGKRFEYADLDTLREMERDLAARISRAGRGLAGNVIRINRS